MGTLALPDGLDRILVALLIGFLIGVDRERAEMRKHRRVFAGVRTFPLIALIGAVSIELIDVAGPLLPLVSFAAVGTVALISYLRSSAQGDIGATTEIAALVTFLLGALAATGRLIVAGALGIAVATLLVFKPRLERFSRALSEAEIAAVIELALIAGIVLPLIPDRGYGPWGVWNPFNIWLVVVLVSAVSFAGFVAMRVYGQQRGLPLAGLIGGMVSSTAVTAAMAARSRESSGAASGAATATTLASTVMCARVAAFAAAFGPGMLPRLAPVVAAMAITGGAAAWALGRHAGAERGAGKPALSNPFSLFQALSFGLLYAVILLIVRATREYLGTAAMYVAAGVSGVVDVDAVTIALARGGPGDDAWRTAAAAVSIAMIVNTVFKIVLAGVMGSREFLWRTALALGTSGVVGALAALAVFVALPV